AHHVRSLPRAPTMAIIDVLESATLTPSPRLLAPPSSSVRGNTRQDSSDGAPVELKLPLSSEQVLLLDRLRNERGSIRLRLWVEVHLAGVARDEAAGERVP